MLFIVKWDATGMTDEENLSNRMMLREDAAALTAKMQAEGSLPLGVHAILGAEVDEDGEWENGVCRVFVKVELVVEAEDPGAAAYIAGDPFLVAIASAMIDEDAQGAYDLGEFVVLDLDVYVDEPDVDLIAALAG